MRKQRSARCFPCNDDMALGASKALHQAGLRIPQDVSLFGFDDAPSAKWLEPGLSTVYLPIDNMITTAIDQAIKLANDQPIETILPFTGTLVLRESVTTGPYFRTALRPAAPESSADDGSAVRCRCRTALPAAAGRLL